MKSIIKLFIFLVCIRLDAQHIPDRVIQYQPGDWMSYPVMRFMNAVAVGQEYVYFGSTYGIGRYNHFSGEWERPWTVSDGLPDAAIQLLSYDKTTGYLWCVTKAGLSYYQPTAEEWRTFSMWEMGVNQIVSLGTGEKNIWLDSGKRIYQGSNQGGVFFESSINEAEQDRVFWMGRRSQKKPVSWNQLMIEPGYFLEAEGVIQDQELRRYSITNYIKDDFGKLWVTTWGMGAAVADIQTWDFSFLPYGPYAPRMDAMAWDGDGMWMGGLHIPGKRGGITWWNMEENTWGYFEAPLLTHLRSDEVTTIMAGDRFVWFGTRDGLARYDKKEDAWRTFSAHQNLWDDHITSLALHDTLLWVGTASGLNRVQLPGMIIERVRDRRLIHRVIHWIEPVDDLVWIGTDLGIYCYDSKIKQWDFIDGYAGMLRPEIKAISIFDDEVWFGTSEGLEVYYRSTGEWEGFPADQHDIPQPIYNILADSANVWIGTQEGVLKLIKEEKRFRQFTVDDGLLANPVHWILLDGDYVWFGTEMGLTQFYWNAPYRID